MQTIATTENFPSHVIDLTLSFYCYPPLLVPCLGESKTFASHNIQDLLYNVNASQCRYLATSLPHCHLGTIAGTADACSSR